VTALNIHYVKKNAADGGQMSYQQVDPKKGDNADRGERLVNGKGIVGHRPQLPDNALTEISNAITGKHEKDVQIDNDKYRSGSTDGMLVVKSEADLKDKLKELKAQHELPVIVRVNSMSEPFYSDSGLASAGGSGGAHVVTITDYDEKTGNVCIDNQWGRSADHDKNNPVSAHQLFIAMQSTAGAERAIKADCQADRDNGVYDPVKHLELLRYQKVNKELDGTQFAQGVWDATKEMQARWAQGGVSDQEKARERKELSNLIHTLPTETQLSIVQEEHKAHLIDDNRYQKELAVMGWKLGKEGADVTRMPGINPSADDKYNKQLTALKGALADLPADKQKQVLVKIAELMAKYK
jgi:hypothetical protein